MRIVPMYFPEIEKELKIFSKTTTKKENTIFRKASQVPIW